MEPLPHCRTQHGTLASRESLEGRSELAGDSGAIRKPFRHWEKEKLWNHLQVSRRIEVVYSSIAREPLGNHASLKGQPETICGPLEKQSRVTRESLWILESGIVRAALGSHLRSLGSHSKVARNAFARITRASLGNRCGATPGRPEHHLEITRTSLGHHLKIARSVPQKSLDNHSQLFENRSRSLARA